jgi:hypothetical protein
MESQIWNIKPSFIDGLSISYPEGYFAENSIADGLSYYSPVVTFKYAFSAVGYNTSISLVNNPEYYSHPAYEYTKFIIDTVINADNRYNYDLQCELRILTDIPAQSWIMDRECTDFTLYPLEYDLDADNLYCTVRVTFHNVVGTRLLLSNLFMRKFDGVFSDRILEDFYDHSRHIFGKKYREFDRNTIDITMDTIEPNGFKLSGLSFSAIDKYIPWMMPDEIDKILKDMYTGPTVELLGYINRNISMFARYTVTINDIPKIEGLTVKEVKLILNKLLVHKRTRRIIDGSKKRINIELYAYKPDATPDTSARRDSEPSLYPLIMNGSSLSDISNYLSSLRGLKRLSFGGI